MRGRYFYAVKQLLPFTESHQPHFKAWRGPAAAGQFLPRAPGEELPLWSILIPAAPILWSQKEICYNFVTKNP